jgi:hypothetical protein
MGVRCSKRPRQPKVCHNHKHVSEPFECENEMCDALVCDACIDQKINESARVCHYCSFNQLNFVETVSATNTIDGAGFHSPLEKLISVTLCMETGKLSGWDSLWD